jgi:two-component system response regulator YesN
MNYLKGMDNQENFNESRMDEILDYIHKNIQKNITRKDIAEAVYLNPEYLSRLFKKEKGIKLSDYIQQEKMNIANHLLRTTNFSVSIVASKVGYSNFSHFAQSFKRVFGISPSEIKQENHK